MNFLSSRPDLIPANGRGHSRCDSIDETEDDKSSIADSFVDVDVDDCCTSCLSQRRDAGGDLEQQPFLSNFDIDVSNFSDDDDDDDDDDDSLSLLDVRRDLTPFNLSERNAGSKNGHSAAFHPPPASDTLSTLSSISSMTLQAGR